MAFSGTLTVGWAWFKRLKPQAECTQRHSFGQPRRRHTDRGTFLSYSSQKNSSHYLLWFLIRLIPHLAPVFRGVGVPQHGAAKHAADGDEVDAGALFAPYRRGDYDPGRILADEEAYGDDGNAFVLAAVLDIGPAGFALSVQPLHHDDLMGYWLDLGADLMAFVCDHRSFPCPDLK